MTTIPPVLSHHMLAPAIEAIKPHIKLNHEPAPNIDHFSRCTYLASELLDTSPNLRRDALKSIVVHCYEWLEDLGVDEPWIHVCSQFDNDYQYKDETINRFMTCREANSWRYLTMMTLMGHLATNINRQVARSIITKKYIAELGYMALMWLMADKNIETK